MDSTGLLSLPVEILLHIAKFLPVEGILACSATCHYLRHTFNDNIVWEKYVPEQFKLGLRTQELCVESAFCLQESITPLCENRVDFIKKTSLVNNWKNGNFLSYSAKTFYRYASGVFNVSKAVGQVIYKGRYLFLGRFINDFESDVIEVWDINKVPVLLMDLKMNVNHYEHFYIVGDCLVVVECIQVKVYEIKISEKSLCLLFSFLITEQDVAYREFVNHSGRHDERCVGWNYSMVNNYLYANKCENEPYICVFHIWDIVNAYKLGTFEPPVMGFSIHYHSHTGNNWFLQMMKQSGNDSYFFQFDINEKSFSEVIFKFNRRVQHSIIYNSLLIFFESSEYNSQGWCDTVCSVYEFSTSEKLKERRLNNARRNYLIKSTKIVNGQFIMLCVDGFHVIDVLTLETLQQFPCESLRFVNHQFNIYGSTFILGANSRNIIEVWDLSKKKKISQDINNVYTSHLYLNESCTKLACVSYYEIIVYHFL